ncbi:hypothetical protein HK405_010946 [Cladochytrium tenue]|nr:hypothetical protein HK405_010946 [Cladochytrium tenue]
MPPPMPMQMPMQPIMTPATPTPSILAPPTPPLSTPPSTPMPSPLMPPPSPALLLCVPPHVLLRVLALLDVPDLLVLERSCRDLHAMLREDDAPWRDQIRRVYARLGAGHAAAAAASARSALSPAKGATHPISTRNRRRSSSSAATRDTAGPFRCACACSVSAPSPLRIAACLLTYGMHATTDRDLRLLARDAGDCLEWSVPDDDIRHHHTVATAPCDVAAIVADPHELFFDSLWRVRDGRWFVLRGARLPSRPLLAVNALDPTDRHLLIPTCDPDCTPPAVVDATAGDRCPVPGTDLVIFRGQDARAYPFRWLRPPPGPPVTPVAADVAAAPPHHHHHHCLVPAGPPLADARTVARLLPVPGGVLVETRSAGYRDDDGGSGGDDDDDAASFWICRARPDDSGLDESRIPLPAGCEACAANEAVAIGVGAGPAGAVAPWFSFASASLHRASDTTAAAPASASADSATTVAALPASTWPCAGSPTLFACSSVESNMALANILNPCLARTHLTFVDEASGGGGGGGAPLDFYFLEVVAVLPPAPPAAVATTAAAAAAKPRPTLFCLGYHDLRLTAVVVDLAARTATLRRCRDDAFVLLRWRPSSPLPMVDLDPGGASADSDLAGGGGGGGVGVEGGATAGCCGTGFRAAAASNTADDLLEVTQFSVRLLPEEELALR